MTASWFYMRPIVYERVEPVGTDVVIRSRCRKPYILYHRLFGNKFAFLSFMKLICCIFA